MNIRLPNLTPTHCKSLTVCGAVRTDDEVLLQWMKEQEPMVARYGRGEAAAYLRAHFGERGKHLHLEVTRGELVKPSRKNRATISEVQRSLDRLEGETVSAEIDGYFLIEKKNAPPIISAGIVETTADGVSIKTAGGRLSVRGAPVHAIHWYLGERDEVFIRLEASRTTVLDENYLESALVLVESAFKVLIRGGRQDV